MSWHLGWRVKRRCKNTCQQKNKSKSSMDKSTTQGRGQECNCCQWAAHEYKLLVITVFSVIPLIRNSPKARGLCRASTSKYDKKATTPNSTAQECQLGKTYGGSSSRAAGTIPKSQSCDLNSINDTFFKQLCVESLRDVLQWAQFVSNDRPRVRISLQETGGTRYRLPTCAPTQRTRNVTGFPVLPSNREATAL